MPRGCLQFVIVVFPDHTHYFCKSCHYMKDGATRAKFIVVESVLESVGTKPN